MARTKIIYDYELGNVKGELDTQKILNAIEKTGKSIKSQSKQIANAMARTAVAQAKKNFDANWNSKTGRVRKNITSKGFSDFNSFVYVRSKKSQPLKNGWYSITLENGRKFSAEYNPNQKLKIVDHRGKKLSITPSTIQAKPFISTAIKTVMANGKAMSAAERKLDLIMSKAFPEGAV